MRNCHDYKRKEFLETLSIIDLGDVIPVLEKGIEVEQVENIIAQSEESDRRVKTSRFFLCFLNQLRLGL